MPGTKLVMPVILSVHWYLAVICFPGLEEPVYKEKSRQCDGNSSESASSNGGKMIQDGNESDDDDFDGSITLSGKKNSHESRRISSRTPFSLQQSDLTDLMEM